MAVSPEGRIFFSACGESYLALHARLYEYDHKNKKLIRHMAHEEKILTSDIALRTSKFHTALSFVGDGTILTTTHTTSPGPNQPTWMPYEYADHPYEAYPGSSLLKYNYLTGESCGLGIFMVKKLTESMEYEYKDDNNVLTLVIALNNL